MIPKAYITQWGNKVKWREDFQIEQDLFLTRIIIELYQDPILKNELALRGGTALQKLFFSNQLRYSEDIDSVQINPGLIGGIVNKIREKIDPWLGEPSWKQNDGRFTLYYKYTAESGVPAKIKLEINTREHFNILGFNYLSFSGQSGWYSGTCMTTTYKLEELLGTKLRALYQRKKGRDFFDLAMALERISLNTEDVITCFVRYMESLKIRITRAEFEQNLALKFQDKVFLNDITALITKDNKYFSNLSEYKKMVYKKIITKLPGMPWKGDIVKYL